MPEPRNPDDAQRELEQHALRNVRGLVDKIESIDKQDKRLQRRLLLAIVAITLAVGTIVVGAVTYISTKQTGKPVVIDPAKLPPVRPGPPPK